MRNEPASHNQPNRQQHRNNRQPVPPRPPQRQQEAHRQHNRRDLARHDVEPAKRQQRPDQRTPQIPRRQRDPRPAAEHVRHAALVRVEAYRLHFPARQHGRQRVAELVEGDDEHLERPEAPADVGHVPEDGDDDHVGGYHAERDLLRVRHCQLGAGGQGRGGGG